MMRVLEVLAELFLIVVGFFLALDGFYMHRLYFVYPEPVVWLDPYISHGYWGIIMVAAGLLGIWSWWKRG